MKKTETDSELQKTSPETKNNTAERRNFLGGLPGAVLGFLGVTTIIESARAANWKKLSAGGVISVTNDISTNSTRYITFVSSNTGTVSPNVSSSKLTFNPSTGDFVAGGNITAYSDDSVKENWQEMPSRFLQDLSQVKSGVYDRTDSHLTQVGVSAQSLKEIMPEAVLQNENGIHSVAYGNAALVAAIELSKEVVKLRTEIEILKKKNETH